MSSRCRDCKRPIQWVIGERGGKIPVDVESAFGDDRYIDRERHTIHFETCPKRARKGRANGQG